MSLFIGMLAFTDAERAAEIRIGVLLGSLAAALAGYLVLRAVTRPVPAARYHLSQGRDSSVGGRRAQALAAAAWRAAFMFDERRWWYFCESSSHSSVTLPPVAACCRSQLLNRSRQA